MNLNGSSWPTYTVGYGSSFADDELADGAETARVLGSKHSSVTITRATFEEALPKIVATLEEPIAASSIVPMYFVCQRARQDVKVALVGQGPDELFGGYRRHLGVAMARYGQAYRAGCVRRSLQRLPPCREMRCSSEVFILWRFRIVCADTKMFSRSYRETKSKGCFKRECCLPRPGALSSTSGQDMGELMSGTDELGGLQFLEVRSTLPDELLMYADKLSMAHGLELRVPFVDKEIVEYVERLPANLKVRNGSRKWLHRQVCRMFLPESIVKRPKRGFAGNVVDDWFRGVIDNKMADMLLDRGSKIYQYLSPAPVGELFKQHASGRNDNHKILFSLTLFEHWLRAHEEPVPLVS